MAAEASQRVQLPEPEHLFRDSWGQQCRGVRGGCTRLLCCASTDWGVVADQLWLSGVDGQPLVTSKQRTAGSTSMQHEVQSCKAMVRGSCSERQPVQSSPAAVCEGTRCSSWRAPNRAPLLPAAFPVFTAHGDSHGQGGHPA